MKDNLPLYVTASAALAKGNHYAGAVPIGQLPRVVEALSGPGTVIDVDLRLGRESGNAAWLRGSLRGALPLTCQRCLQVFDWSLGADVALRLVASEAEEARVLSDCEPLLVEDDRLPLRQVVEDEVLLALPLAPRCDREGCQPEIAPP